METKEVFYLTMEQVYEARKVRQWAADQRMLRIAKGQDKLVTQLSFTDKLLMELEQ